MLVRNCKHLCFDGQHFTCRKTGRIVRRSCRRHGCYERGNILDKITISLGFLLFKKNECVDIL